MLLLFVHVVMLQLADKQMNRGRRGGGGKETEYRKMLMQGALSTVPLSAAPPKQLLVEHSAQHWAGRKRRTKRKDNLCVDP